MEKKRYNEKPDSDQKLLNAWNEDQNCMHCSQNYDFTLIKKLGTIVWKNVYERYKIGWSLSSHKKS